MTDKSPYSTAEPLLDGINMSQDERIRIWIEVCVMRGCSCLCMCAYAYLCMYVRMICVICMKYVFVCLSGDYEYVSLFVGQCQDVGCTVKTSEGDKIILEHINASFRPGQLVVRYVPLLVSNACMCPCVYARVYSVRNECCAYSRR
jgi:hypothetical protein